MDSAVHDEAFQHKPLPEPHTHFRLLKIIQGGFDEHVICELSIWPINNAPPYIAISYVWGDPASVSTITVNSRPVTVRTNCEYVLQQQASASDTSQYYFWVDAVCIDQQSSTEKSHQVALMGRLFGNALHVYACVGPHYDDSQYLLDATGPTSPFFSRLCRNVVHHPFIDDTPVPWGLSKSEVKGRWLSILCLLTANARTRKRLLQAFVALLKRPYFSRVWILQELFLGKDISLCCGQSRTPIVYILAFNKLVNIWCDWEWVTYVGPRVLTSIVFRSADLCRFPRRVWKSSSMSSTIRALAARRGCLVLADSKLARYPALVILEALKDFECDDARDRIFGALSMTDWKDGNAPVPDYHKERFQVAVETMGIIMSRTQASFEREYMYSRPSMMAIAALLRTSLGVLPEEESMQTAIDMRRQSSLHSHPHSEHVKLTARLKQLPPLNSSAQKLDVVSYHAKQLHESGWVDEDWQGVELGFECSEEPGPIRVKENFSDTDGESNFSYLYCGDRIIAYGPPDTKKGDWILWHTSFATFQWNSTIKYSVIAITIRPLANGTHGLVGFVYLNPKKMEASALRKIRPYLKQFDIYWHAQDLLLMEWHYSKQRPEVCSSSAMSSWLQMRICIEEGSSFAQGPRDRPKYD
jgi:hypothetical protein